MAASDELSGSGLANPVGYDFYNSGRQQNLMLGPGSKASGIIPSTWKFPTSSWATSLVCMFGLTG